MSHRFQQVPTNMDIENIQQQPKKYKVVLISSILTFCILFFLICLVSSIHQIPEGHVGVYFRGGALLDSISYPGYNVKLPFITDVHHVQVTIQTDEVKDIPCGTSGGVIIKFKRIEVVNLLNTNSVINIVRNYTINYDKPLVFDKVHHEINQFCSSRTLQEVYVDHFDQIDEKLQQRLQTDLDRLAPGLTVEAVRVTKPQIPLKIETIYKARESEKTSLLVAIEHQKVVEKKAETEKKKAIIEAEKNREVSRIEQNRLTMEKENQKNISQLEDERLAARNKAAADANFYKDTQESESNKVLLTENYLELKKIEAISKQNKIYYGNGIETFFYP